MDTKFDSQEYVRSRRAYIVFCAVDYYITIAVTDTFLAKILSDMGISDILTGMISSFVSLAFLFEIFLLLSAHRIRHAGKCVTVLCTAGALLFSALYLVPELPMGSGGKAAIVLFLIVTASFCKYFAAPLLFKLANSFVAPEKRGEYSASKEMFSLWTGILFTLAAGFLIDYFEMKGSLRRGFGVIAALLFACSLILFICLRMIGPQPPGRTKSPEISFLQVCRYLAGNRNFRHVILMTCLWNIALYMTMGYLGIYKIKELGFTVGTIQVITMAASLLRFLVSKPFGRYADSHSFARGIKAASGIAAAAFLVCAFTAPGSRWLIVVFTLLYSVSQAGIVQNFNNITYSYVDQRYLVQAVAIKDSVGGVCGLGASLAGGVLLNLVQGNGNRLLGMPVFGQQVLSFLTFVLILVLIGYIHCVIEKQEIIRQ